MIENRGNRSIMPLRYNYQYETDDTMVESALALNGAKKSILYCWQKESFSIGGVYEKIGTFNLGRGSTKKF